MARDQHLMRLSGLYTGAKAGKRKNQCHVVICYAKDIYIRLSDDGSSSGGRYLRAPQPGVSAALSRLTDAEPSAGVRRGDFGALHREVRNRVRQEECSRMREEQRMSAETFELLLGPNLRSVRKLVHTRLSRSGEAEDVMQDILLRAFARRHQLRAHAKFRFWLWSIALNEIRGWFRRHHGVVSFDEVPDLVARDEAMSPLAAFEQNNAREWLRACCAKLPERDQAAIRLRDIEGKSIRQAAAALHSSEGAIKSAHFRARQRLSRIVRASVLRSDALTCCAAVQN